MKAFINKTLAKKYSFFLNLKGHANKQNSKKKGKLISFFRTNKKGKWFLWSVACPSMSANKICFQQTKQKKKKTLIEESWPLITKKILHRSR